MVHKGRVVTISDLKEVLKAKTEETAKRQGESYYSWERPVDNSQSSAQTLKDSKNST